MLAVEELSRVDAAVGVLVDVQNTLAANAVLRANCNPAYIHTRVDLSSRLYSVNQPWVASNTANQAM